MNPLQALHASYPKQMVVNGKTFSLKSETVWTRRYSSDDGDFCTMSRLLDGSFDFAVLDTLNIACMSKSERSDAALALNASGRENLPLRWKTLIENWKTENNLE